MGRSTAALPFVIPTGGGAEGICSFCPLRNTLKVNTITYPDVAFLGMATRNSF
jgi:hypothetical protein